MNWDAAAARSARSYPNRSRDLRLLKGVIDSGQASDSEAEAFADMLARIEDAGQLSDKQREWVTRVAERVGCAEPEYENLVSSGKVKPLPANFPKFDFERMPKPLKPPGRR